MDAGADRNYLAYLRHYYAHNDNPPPAHAITYGEPNPNPNPNPTLHAKPPKRRRIGREHDPGANGGERSPLAPDSGWPRKREKEFKEEGLKKGKEIETVSRSYDLDYHNYLSHMRVVEGGGFAVVVGGEVVVRYEKEVESGNGDEGLEAESESEKNGAVFEGGEEDEKADNVRQKEDQSKEVEIDCGQASHEPDIMNPHLQAFVSLVRKFCPVESTIFPGYTGNKTTIIPTGEPSTITNLEKKPNREEKRGTNRSSPKGFFDFDWIEDKGDEEVMKVNRRLRRKGNRSGSVEKKGLVAFPDLPDSDDEPQMDEIPRKILRRPPSDYREKLIEELRRPFDKSEYVQLMNEATIRKKKVVYKELRSVLKSVVTEEESKSMFDFHPEFKAEVEGAKYLRQLTLLRGFFFWLKNCCYEGSFMPWEKGYNKEIKGAQQY